ncbi:hypothetical protein MRB53_012561 [Persea americana]|uniref:Uncharacterized protein n=1 Tax=Persea americana TaxID=3435 RepID=A0ACC2LZ39_PERAE|nr:hypothetical protein MRB53_012561 [Persea americana]
MFKERIEGPFYQSWFLKLYSKLDFEFGNKGLWGYMAFFVAILEGLALCTSTVWALHERRFSSFYNIVSSAVRSFIRLLISSSPMYRI